MRARRRSTPSARRQTKTHAFDIQSHCRLMGGAHDGHQVTPSRNGPLRAPVGGKVRKYGREKAGLWTIR